MHEKCYVLADFKIVQIEVGTALKLVEQQSGKDVFISISNSQATKRSLKAIPEGKSIGEVFNYQGNLIKVSC